MADCRQQSNVQMAFQEYKREREREKEERSKYEISQQWQESRKFSVAGGRSKVNASYGAMMAEPNREKKRLGRGFCKLRKKLSGKF
jgi:hypothetical protein